MALSLKTAVKAQKSALARQPLLTPISKITRRGTDWLWWKRIAYGKATLLVGDPGGGKSFMTYEIAARESNGELLPGSEDGAEYEPGKVLLMSSEDDPEDALRPRLEDLGADLDRVTLLSGLIDNKGNITGISFRDVQALTVAIERVNPTAVIVDPIISFAAGVDTNAASKVRVLLNPIIRLAQEYRFALVGVMHLNKNEIGKVLYRTQGTVDFVGIARSVLAIAPDPNEPSRKVLCQVKNNYGALQPSLAFSIEEIEEDRLSLVWHGISPYTVNDLFDIQQQGSTKKVDLAKAFLRGILYRGPCPSADVESMAGSLGISTRTLKRAREEIGVQADRVGGAAGDGSWMLSLPGYKAPPPPEIGTLTPLGVSVAQLAELLAPKLLENLQNSVSSVGTLRTIDNLAPLDGKAAKSAKNIKTTTSMWDQISAK